MAKKQTAAQQLAAMKKRLDALEKQKQFRKLVVKARRPSKKPQRQVVVTPVEPRPSAPDVPSGFVAEWDEANKKWVVKPQAKPEPKAPSWLDHPSRFIDGLLGKS